MAAKSYFGHTSFSQREQSCELSFNNGGPFWHLHTNGRKVEILFETTEDYRFIINIFAIVSYKTGVHILSYEVMDNHIHIILEGSDTKCREFFDMVKTKLARYYKTRQRFVRLEGFECQLVPIDSLKSLRYEIAYTHRNAYLANKSYTPYSYPWGTGHLYFNPLAEHNAAVKYKELKKNEKREICCGRELQLPEQFVVADGMILPQSFCAIRYGESMFRDANQYFSIVSKNYEAYSEIARHLGDDIFLNDDEMFAALSIQCKKLYGDIQASMLPNKDKIEMAKRMRRDYNASDGQIQRMLRLDRTTVEQLFGKA